MLSVKTSKIMENLTMGRGHFAVDTAGNRAWTGRFAAKAKVPDALVAAAFFGKNLNQKIGGKFEHSSEMIDRLSQYVASKLENHDLPPDAQHNLMRVAHFVTQSIASRFTAGVASASAAYSTRQAPAAAQPRRSPVTPGPAQPRPPVRQASPARTPGALPLADAEGTEIKSFNSSLIGANRKFKEADGLVEQMEAATGADRARLKFAAKKALRAVRDDLSGLLKEPVAKSHPKKDLAIRLRATVSQKIQSLL